MKKITPFLLSICVLASAFFPLKAKAERIVDPHTTLEYNTYEEYLAVMKTGSVQVNGDLVSLPEGLMVFDEITCLGVFESVKIEVYDRPQVGPYFFVNFLLPGFRTTVMLTYSEPEEKMQEPTISFDTVGDRLTDLAVVTNSGYLKIDRLYYDYSCKINYNTNPNVKPYEKYMELYCVIWFKDGCKFCLGWDETTDTSPLFDKLTEEQLSEMEAFREGLLSKANCVSTMEAVDYLPGLLGTGMKIEEDDSSVPTGIYEETSAEPSAETTSAPAVSEPKELSAGFWVFVGAGIGILAVTITALILLLRKKKEI